MENPATNCPKCGSPVAAGASEGLCTRCLLAVAAHPTEAGTDAGAPPGRRIEPAPLAQVAAAFPQLEVIELIGVGGMGAVYKARQPKLDRWVALKILPESHGREAAFAERFLREARMLARLSHPHIVAVHDFGQAEEFFYLLMEYVDGVNLRQAMRAGRFSSAQALMLVPQICEALQFAHDHGVMHRDVKPENILLDARGQVKLVDFGIAKLLGSSAPEPGLTVTGAAVGTPQYMAPEQIERPGDVDHRADIYSLGVVFYELLTGELPLGRFAPPSSKTPLDTRVDEIVLRALAKERELRQQSADEVRTAVERVGTPAPPSRARRTSEVQEPIESEGEAPLWQTSLRFRLLALVALLGYAVAMVIECRFRLFGITLDMLHVGVQGDNLGVSLALLVVVGILAWAVERLVRGERAWLAPLRLPSNQHTEASGPNLADRGIRLALLVLLGCFGAALAMLWANAGAGIAGQLRAPASAWLPFLVVVLVPPAVVAGAWFHGWREHARMPACPRADLPAWTKTVALAFAVYGLVATLSGLLSRVGEVVVYAGLGDFVLPTVLALWFRSRFWRGVAVVLNACAGIQGLTSIVGLAWLGFQFGSLASAESGLGGATPHYSWFQALFGDSMAAFVFTLGWWTLRSPAVRRAFGQQALSSERPNPATVAAAESAASRP